MTTDGDARADALSRYLRERAAAFSLSADHTDQMAVALAGMALLDAAALAAGMSADDPRLSELSERGYFESMPGGRARFRESPQMRSAVQRPLSSHIESGEEILSALVAAARAHPRRLS